MELKGKGAAPTGSGTAGRQEVPFLLTLGPGNRYNGSAFGKYCYIYDPDAFRVAVLLARRGKPLFIVSDAGLSDVLHGILTAQALNDAGLPAGPSGIVGLTYFPEGGFDPHPVDHFRVVPDPRIPRGLVLWTRSESSFWETGLFGQVVNLD